MMSRPVLSEATSSSPDEDDLYAFKEEPCSPVVGYSSGNTFLVIIVTSYAGNIKQRRAHRMATPVELLRSVNATRVFLLAQVPENEKNITQFEINYESKFYGDILQGTFVESYRNLTYKHLMGLKWASTMCQDASFILKVDDDTVYNLERTYALLNSVEDPTDLVMGYLHYITMPSRNKKSKWYVTRDEYPSQIYPEFVSGWYYITTPKVAADLCDEAYYHSYFWIDDVFVTGILTEALGIPLTRKPDEYLNQSMINDENDNYGDILQGSFVESFKNLTYKHLMGLKWASTMCRDASFVLKLDDDTVFNLRNTYALLASIENSTSLLLGYINDNANLGRDKEHDLDGSLDEYPRREYPPFLAGWYYITTPQVAAALCKEAVHHPYFWVDDLFITGLLPEALGMKLTRLPQETYWRDNNMNCNYDPEENQFECIKFIHL